MQNLLTLTSIKITVNKLLRYKYYTANIHKLIENIYFNNVFE